MVLTVLLTFTLKSCTKDEYTTGTITVTTAKKYQVGFIIRIPKDSRNNIIEWGDGKSNVNEAFQDETGYDFHEFRFLSTPRLHFLPTYN